MNFIKKFKAIIAIGISDIVLAISFYYPNPQKINTNNQVNKPVIEGVLMETVDHAETKAKETITPTHTAPLEILEPDAKVKIQEETIEKNVLSCSFAVRCDTLLNNMDSIAPEKIYLIPESGSILPETEFEFSEGESAFDVLERELKRRKIHFEFTNVPMYDSIYIEGIGNLYEFDAGFLSGWIYRVNGEILSVGCSQYKLKNGDKIEFLYTCNMGKDL